ncbi:unnamed protein product [Effrenium voratum]|nr:unnamed protein product [Effrenium voratum]
MEHGAFARLRKELLELAEDPPAGCWCDDTASYVSHPFLYWQALVAGPEGTPYEEGLFRLVLVFKDYPWQPPDIMVTTKILHCNVALNGLVKMEVLGNWTPTRTVKELLLAFRALLASPVEAEGFAAVPEAAWLRRFHRWEHDALARQCTETFARRNQAEGTEPQTRV